MWSYPDAATMARNQSEMAGKAIKMNIDDTSDPPFAPSNPKFCTVSRMTQSNLDEPHGMSPTNSSFNISLTPGSQDRVFPIRSVVSVDPNLTPLIRPETDGYYAGIELIEQNGTRRTDSRRQSIGSASSDHREIEPITNGKVLHKSRTHSRPASRADSELSRTSNDRISLGSKGDMPHKPEFVKVKSGLYEQRRLPGEQQDNDDAESTQSTSASTKSGVVATTKSTPGDGEVLITARFRHVVTDAGHVILTGRDGDTLQRCEDEPIHVPGAVQCFGLLIAMSEDAEGRLVVRVASENSQRILGYTPQQLFSLENFCDILSEEQADNLQDHLEFIKDSDTDPAQEGPEVFTISIKSPITKKTHKMWCAMHINPVSPSLILCEFELENDQNYPLVPPEEFSAEVPDTLSSNPTLDELAESTQNLSKPLRVLRSARRKNGDAAAMEILNIMSQAQEQLAATPNLEAFLKVLVGVIKELTGFHRVMVYQFDADWHGRVVTELVDPRATKDLYQGLNFPASDIPKQAREMYKINKVRLLYDRDNETARLVSRSIEDLHTPIDMTYGYLRAMSPIHIKYLENMAVRSSMSVSINAFNELWGLIACHSYGSRGMRVSFPIRKICRLIGDSASRNIERLSYASRLQARKLINTIPTVTNPSGYIVASSDDLLALFDADCGLLSIKGETKILGNIQTTQEALALLEYFRLRKPNSVTTSQDIRIDFPDLRYEPGFKTIAGVLLVPLSVSGSDFIIFFRQGQLREVKWAGNPYEKFVKEGTEGYLEPRKSFKTWSETVVGKSKEWSEAQVETAAVLCLVYGKFIEVWRQKEAAVQNTELTRLLLANSAHEVRTPLNAIINYLEIAMEGSLDPETRENLSKSHSASKSLIYVINDLLDLTKTEQGNDLVRDDVFDLTETIMEATDMFANDARRKKLKYVVNVNDGVPKFVLGDQRRVRQVISNLIANAIQNTSSGFINVNVYLVRSEGDPPERADIDIVVEDSGTGMSSKNLDQLFMELEQVQSEEMETSLNQVDCPTEQKSMANGESKNRILGLGLAVVSRIVRNMNGQLRLKSEEGIGSRFVIQLGFDLPPPGVAGKQLYGNSRPASTKTNDTYTTTTPITEGEIMLVAKSNEHLDTHHPGVSRRHSRESVASMKSFNSIKSNNSARSIKTQSSIKSDVDRLIDAIQEPHMVNSHSVKSPTGSKRRSALEGRRPTIRSTTTAISSRTLDESTNRALENSNVYKQVAHAGSVEITDSSIPMRAVRVSEDEPVMSVYPNVLSKVAFNISSQIAPRPSVPSADFLKVLVAEDDPINSKIITKRLQKLKHSVHCTVNGEACATAYGEKHKFYDVVLMDMQMPIVDGLTSTKMIRSYEKAHTGILSERAINNGRVPIIAVSASLVEKDREKYIETGFDGWILKPIDFKRLSVLMSGIVDNGARDGCLYKPGNWEHGGWFARSDSTPPPCTTKPDPAKSVSTMPSPGSHGDSALSSKDRISQEQDRLSSLEKSAAVDPSIPDKS